MMLVSVPPSPGTSPRYTTVPLRITLRDCRPIGFPPFFRRLSLSLSLSLFLSLSLPLPVAPGACFSQSRARPLFTARVYARAAAESAEKTPLDDNLLGIYRICWICKEVVRKSNILKRYFTLGCQPYLSIVSNTF